MNDAAEVLAAFKTYYDTAELETTTDPHIVYELRAKLGAAGYYDDFEVNRVVQVEMDPKGTQSQLSGAIAPVADRLLKRYKAAQTEKAHAESLHDDKATQAARDVLDALILFKGDTSWVYYCDYKPLPVATATVSVDGSATATPPLLFN